MRIELGKPIEEGLEEMKQAIIESQNQLGLVDSGNSISSIRINAGLSGKAFLSMTGYTGTLFDRVGRKPGTVPNIDALAKWGKLQTQGNETRKQAAWRLGLYIAEHGTLIYPGNPNNKSGIPIKQIVRDGSKDIARRSAGKIAADYVDELNSIIIKGNR